MYDSSHSDALSNDEDGKKQECCPDIEDLIGTEGPSNSDRGVLPRSLRRHTKPPVLIEGDSFLPGSGQSVYIKTWGCSHNTSDGEYMAGLLSADGYTITDSPIDAYVWLLNSCTVKGPSEDGFKSAIRKGKELNKTLVVAGCVPQGQKDLEDIKGVSAVGVSQIDRIVEVVEGALNGNVVRLFGSKRSSGRQLAGPSLELPKIRRNPLIEIIPINSGCLNHCTYCKTKHSRGNLASYYPSEIVARAVQAFSEGVVEVWLTSEDTGAYGRDIGVSLPELLWQLVKVTPEGCMLRIGMTNPPYIMEHLEEIGQILLHPRVYSFLHIPVQSGADPVLAAMKREYTVAQFKQVVNYLKEHVPGVTIATDIICGFPTENEEDFKESLSLVKEFKFPSLFINQFYPRPGTPAAKMKKLPTHEVKKRSRELTDLFHSYNTYTNREGTVEMVLVTEVSHDGKYYVGHTKYYEQVLVPQLEGLMGGMAYVKIISTGKHFMKGEIIDLVQHQHKKKVKKDRESLGSIVGSPSVSSAIFRTSNMLLLVVLIITGLIIMYRLPQLAAVLNKLYLI